MKPLELTIYEHRRTCECCSGWYKLPGSLRVVGPTEARRRAEAKRLTDSELAAEYFNAEALCRCIIMHDEGNSADALTREGGIQYTLHRFATHDHYDHEDDA